MSTQSYGPTHPGILQLLQGAHSLCYCPKLQGFFESPSNVPLRYTKATIPAYTLLSLNLRRMSHFCGKESLLKVSPEMMTENERQDKRMLYVKRSRLELLICYALHAATYTRTRHRELPTKLS